MADASNGDAGPSQTPPAEHDDAKHIPDWSVKEAFTRLKATYGDQLNARLQDPEIAERFIHDPIGTLRSFGWEIPEEIGRLAARTKAKPDMRGPSVLLANGQVIRPRFYVSFRTPDKGANSEGGA